MNVKGVEGENEEDEDNELYRDVNINLKGRDVRMADVQTTQYRYTYYSIFELTQRVYVPVMTTTELPLLSATTLPPPSIPIISHVQQTPAPSPANVSSSSLQDLPNFGTLFGFDHRLKTLETNFLEFMQTNQFAEAISLIPDTVTFKRRQDDEDKDEEPFAGSNRGSRRRRAGKEPDSTNVPKEKTSKTFGKSTEGTKSHHKTASESAPAERPMHTTQVLEEPAPQEFKTCATDDQPVEEASQHPHWF
nr:hypothetical protein [Tanacetum cinerariifolium]